MCGVFSSPWPAPSEGSKRVRSVSFSPALSSHCVRCFVVSPQEKTGRNNDENETRTKQANDGKRNQTKKQKTKQKTTAAAAARTENPRPERTQQNKEKTVFSSFVGPSSASVRPFSLSSFVDRTFADCVSKLNWKTRIVNVIKKQKTNKQALRYACSPSFPRSFLFSFFISTAVRLLGVVLVVFFQLGERFLDAVLQVVVADNQQRLLVGAHQQRLFWQAGVQLQPRSETKQGDCEKKKKKKKGTLFSAVTTCWRSSTGDPSSLTV